MSRALPGGPRSRRRVRARLARGAPPLAVALAATLLGAARALDPETAGGVAWLRETGGALALGALFLGAGHGAACAARLRRRRGSGAARAREGMRMLRRSAADAGTVLALGLPVLAVGWELGASLSAIVAAGLAVGVAALAGAAGGAAAGATGLSAPPATFAGAALAALLLWPGALGWIGVAARSFPAPELPPWGTALGILAALALAAGLSGGRSRWAG